MPRECGRPVRRSPARGPESPSQVHVLFVGEEVLVEVFNAVNLVKCDVIERYPTIDRTRTIDAPQVRRVEWLWIRSAPVSAYDAATPRHDKAGRVNGRRLADSNVRRKTRP